MFTNRFDFYRHPRGHFDRINAQMNALRRAMEEVEPSRARGTMPLANVTDRGESYRVELLVPGLGQDDFQVTFAAETLTVRGEVKVEAPEGYAVHRRERRPGPFVRSFTFAQPVDVDKIAARLDSGVLTIELPRSPELQPRRIPITVA